MTDIYDRIRADHDTHRDLMAKIAATQGEVERRRKLFARFVAEHDSHLAAEEKTFYAALIELDDGHEEARHGIHEHYKSAKILEELQEMDIAANGWLQRFATMKDELEHHFKDEEDDIFPHARGLFSDEDAREMGEEFTRQKERFLQDA